MREGGLVRIWQLRRRFSQRRIPENWVVTKAVRADRGVRDLAFDRGFRLEQNRVAASDRERGDESRRAIVPIDAPEDFLEAIGIWRRHPHEAGGQHAGLTVHGIDFEA